ncbi:MAG: NAD(P)-binding domain-containing protein [Alphaproteobacteria bacterium]|nr:NAD(P)-binding domain-containing protein [Alphaproteobacteria bacterium]
MMVNATDVAIIGAGPYGLSLAAHLAARGVEHAVIGAPMAGWSKAMPRGMHLKSEGFASNLFDPSGATTLERYCAEHSIPYAPVGLPVALDTFIAYGVDFQRRHVPHVEQDVVISLERTEWGFVLRLAGGGTLSCRRVVVAVGVIPFRNVPASLAGLPGELLSHSSAHHDLDQFRGRDVTVIGGGASAIDLAALLHEGGACVRMIQRDPQLQVHTKSRLPRPLKDRIRNPMSGIGPSWRSLFYTKAPFAFYHLPEARRLRIVRTHLGPAGGWFMADRIARVPTILGCSVRTAIASGSRARLLLAEANGSTRSIETDHVIAATGYKPDLCRLDFLGDALRAQIPTVDGAPLLSSRFETKVPGLFMIGTVSANCFGPVMRFAVGAGLTARSLARHLARRRPGVAETFPGLEKLVEIGQKASPT